MQRSAKSTYTAASQNFCGKWDRTIFVHEFIPHEIIHLEEKIGIEADEKNKAIKHM